MTRKFGKPRKETRQMAANTPAQTGTDAGAVSHGEADWDSIDWNAAHKNVCRLQMRIVKAPKEKKWGKVKALQRILTRSFSGKALAVRRVTENQGRKTPGVDGEIWTMPSQKAKAIRELRQKGYHRKALRRMYIPKSSGKMRPLSIPIWAAHCPSSQAMFGIPWVFLLVDRNARSTLLVSFYHRLMRTARRFVLPLPLGWLAQGCNDLRSHRNPTWAQRSGANALQTSGFAPLGNGRNIHIEQICCGPCRVAPISPLSGGDRFRTFWTPCGDLIRIANPLNLADRQRASHARLLSFCIENSGNLRIRLGGRPFPDPVYHLWTGLTQLPRVFAARDGQVRHRFCLPTKSDVNDIAAFGEGHILDQGAHQLLTLHECRGRSVPDGWQIAGEVANLLALRGREHQRRLWREHGILPLQFFHFFQLLIPLSLQAASYQTVVRINGSIATSGKVCLVLGSFNLALPLLIDLLGTRFDQVQRRESHFQVGRLDGFQKGMHDSLIDAISPHRLAGFRAQLRMSLIALVDQQRSLPLRANTHPSATGATQDDPLHERWPFANRASMLFRPPGTVIVELSLIAQELFPGDVAWMRIQPHNGPIFLFD